MATIFESKNFIVESFETPHIDRDDGGHLKIYPKKRTIDRQHLDAD